MQDSLWRSSARAFLITFFCFLAFFAALGAIVWLFSTIDSTEESVTSNFTVEILPNANGVRKKMSKDAPVILQIDIHGIIGGTELTQSLVEKLLIESRENQLKNDRVKGVFLHINSPGGTVNDANGIYQALKLYKTRYKTPIIAYVDGLCASGGMYVACAADEIYGSDVSIIGSIGVLTSPFLNFSKLMEKVGVESLTISAGKGKDDLDPLRPWKEDEDKNIRDLINYYYLSFVDLVTKNRPKVNRSALIEEYGAKVFPAVKAEEIGFIDGADDSRETALKKLLVKIGIEDDYYQVVALESSNWLTQLFKAESPLITGKIQHEFLLDGETPTRLFNQPLYLFRP